MTKSRRPVSHIYFAACPPGSEDALYAELKRLRFPKAERQMRGAKFEGPVWEGWRAALELRTAVRVYRQIARFPAPDAEALYRGAMEVPWETLLTPEDTFAIDAHAHESEITHTGFLALKVKDAVADRMRNIMGARPSVDTEAPVLRLFAHVYKNRCTLSLDIAGRSLHRRGYRVSGVEAPISECLAAAAIEYSGWDEKSPFLDPMCGSGTILIEAGMRASDMAPGLIDPNFAFLRHPDFDAGRWQELLAAAKKRINIPKRLIIRGSDANPDAVNAARRNVEKAGLSDLIQVVVAEIHDFRPKPGWGATIVSNPPYGKRLEDEQMLLTLYNEMGKIFRERCGGYAVHLFVTSGNLARAFQLKPEKYWPFIHGGIPVRLYQYLMNSST